MKSSDTGVAFDQLVAEEELLLAATEVVSEAMQRRGVNKKQLAALLGVSQGEVTQRLSGVRNLTLRSLAAMLHVLDARPELAGVDLESVAPVANKQRVSNMTVIQPRHLTLVPSSVVPRIATGGEWHRLADTAMYG